MPRLPYETVGFPGSLLRLATTGSITVTWPELAWAAATVGVSPVIAHTPSRPLIEMAWRALMVRSSMTDRAGNFAKSPSYTRLDPSEKSAVSYFLGMAQVKLTGHRVLGVTHLTHLDSLPGRGVRARRRSRPDFVGIDIRSHTLSVAIEAKGRTHGWTRTLVDSAKCQARSLPGVAGSSTLDVASVAWFDTDGLWHAYLEDPPRVGDNIRPTARDELLVGYYRPIVAALSRLRALDPSLRPGRAGVPDGMVGGELPDSDMTIHLPESLVAAVETYTPLAESDSRGSKDEVTPFQSAVVAATSEAFDGQSDTRFTGPDGVTIELGESWRT